jgi:hypothetical protein
LATSYQKNIWKKLTSGFVPLAKLKADEERIILLFSTFPSVHYCLFKTRKAGAPAVKSLRFFGRSRKTVLSLVVSHSTCPPLSSSPHANSFVIGPAVIKHTHNPISGTGAKFGTRLCFTATTRARAQLTQVQLTQVPESSPT